MPIGQKPHLTIVVLNNFGRAVVQQLLGDPFPLYTTELTYINRPIPCRCANPAIWRCGSTLTAMTIGTARCFFGISGYLETA
jgi:hypothetical protein